MKKLIRVVAMVLILASMFALISSVAFAATSKKATNGVFTVDTGKSFWGKPTVKIKNTGSTKMMIIVENPNGSWYTHVNALEPGKTVTLKLKANSTFDIYWSGTYSANAAGTITAGRAIKGIW